ASMRSMRRASACWRRSVDVSTRIYRTAVRVADSPSRGPMSMRIDGRVRWACGSVGTHTAQRHPMNRAPSEVPLPRTVTRTTRGPGLATRNSRLATRRSQLAARNSRLAARGSRLVAWNSRVNDARCLAARLDKAHPQLVENLLEHLALFGREVAPRFLFEQRQDVDHLRRSFEVLLGLLTRRRIGEIAEMNGGGACQRQHEGGERELRHLVVILANARIRAPRRDRRHTAVTGRLPVGSRADHRFAQTLRARGNV